VAVSADFVRDGMLNLRCAAATDVGLVREGNEDGSFTSRGIFAVADGMGGHAAGEVASALVLSSFEQLAQRDDITPDDIVSTISDANATILRSAAVNVEQLDMGTTVSGIGVVRVGGLDHWAVFNVGDSRVYRYAAGTLTQVTVDHSEVEELLSTGRISSEEARRHPHRNVVTRSLGSNPGPTPDVWVFPPTVGERFLICSDGLTLEVDDDEIARILAASSDPKSTAEELVTCAVDAGGRDNVTVVVVDLVSTGAVDELDADTAPRPKIAS
jgi:serine/threonine protein phosphatase PrpC